MILRSLFKVWRCKQCVIALRKKKKVWLRNLVIKQFFR
nr:MAG TPA: hypothetical protein [Caudoviricetes sp.]